MTTTLRRHRQLLRLCLNVRSLPPAIESLVALPLLATSHLQRSQQVRWRPMILSTSCSSHPGVRFYLNHSHFHRPCFPLLFIHSYSYHFAKHLESSMCWSTALFRPAIFEFSPFLALYIHQGQLGFSQISWGLVAIGYSFTLMELV